MQRYVDTSHDDEKRISKVIDQLLVNKMPLVVLPVRTYNLHPVESTDFSTLNIVGFADCNKQYHNQTPLRKPTLAPSELKAYSQPILISSYAFQPHIEEQIRQTLGLPNDKFTLKERCTQEEQHLQL